MIFTMATAAFTCCNDHMQVTSLKTQPESAVSLHVLWVKYVEKDTFIPVQTKFLRNQEVITDDTSDVTMMHEASVVDDKRGHSPYTTKVQ